jgi:hypothetical protein
VILGAELSSEHVALLAPTRHEHRNGLYWDHGVAPPLPLLLTYRGNECDPPVDASNGSPHLLLPPGPRGRTLPLVMRWVARERAWARPGGNRMAFTAEYLAHNGWRYLGRATT